MLLNNETVSLQTQTSQCAQFSKASTQVSQNAILLRTLAETPYLVKPENVAPSVFGNLPVATDREVALAIQPLTYCFPQMPSQFWGFLSKKAIQGGLSKQRLDYIVSILTNTHHYATFTIADFFDIDKYIHELTPAEVNNPKAPMAQIFFAGKYRIVYEEDARNCGYEYKHYESVAEREERERREDEQRWAKEYEEMVKRGEVDPNAPLKGLAELSKEIVEQFTIKKDDEKK